VREIAVTMLMRRISGLPVVDDERRVIGIVSEGDLIRRPELETDKVRRGWLALLLSQEDRASDFVKSHGLKASQVMTRPAICVGPDAPLSEIVQQMDRRRVKRLPVVVEGRLAGIVTRIDLLRAFALRLSSTPAVAATDQDLRDGIEALLRSEDWAASANVYVEVEHGTVRLRGTIDSVAQREALLIAVRSLPGVREVELNLGRTLAG
jgi:CBS domain-containing protein